MAVCGGRVVDLWCSMVVRGGAAMWPVSSTAAGGGAAVSGSFRSTVVDPSTAVDKSSANISTVLGGTKKKENQSFQKQMGASSCSQSQNPTFQIKMMPSHVLDRRSTPDIPTSFVRKYMKRRDADALLNVLDGRTWPVKYSSGVRRTRLMHSGWNKFVKDNYLQVGDVCKFELIDPHKILFRVVISRSTTGGILGSSSKQSLDRKTSSIKTEAANVEFF